jgi:tetratricopeptide (TPR) repeat protein
MQGAAVLVKEAQANRDAAVKDDVAYQLARANVGLKEALPLANTAVDSAEHDCAADSATPARRAQFAAEVALARDWNTLGYIYYRQGDSETAKSYIESAFKLDPTAHYGSHLARILEQSGDTGEAIALYRAAIQARGSDQIKATMRERLAALAGASAESPAAAEEEIPDTGKLAGSAFFDITYFSSTKSPTVEFVGGAEPLRTLIAAIAQQERTSFVLPDTGPERVVRRIEVTCDAQTGASSGCRLRTLGAHEARDLLSGN